MTAAGPVLTRFAATARRLAQSGYYATPQPASPAPSLAARLRDAPGIVAELKPASPTQGTLRAMADPGAVAAALVKAGAAGLSALTMPERFGGSPHLLAAARTANAPLLMKDFVVTDAQLALGQAAGASAVLLIEPLLSRDHSEWSDADAAIAAAHARGLEVIYEVYDAAGLHAAATTRADIIGLNARDLRLVDLLVNHAAACAALAACPDVAAARPTLILSGTYTADDVRRARAAAARGVLVGTHLMQDADPAHALARLLEGLS